MHFSRKILVALDSSDAAEKALKRAVLIAERMQATLEVLWLWPVQPDHPLKQLLARLEVDGMTIEQYQHSEKSLLDDVLQRWELDRFALLVKSCDPKHKGVMTPQDWQLMRHTPCPVLLVKQDALWEGGKILAAVNPATSEKANTQHTALKMAQFIAGAAPAALHLASAYPPPMLGAEPAEQTNQALLDNTTHQVEQIVQQLGVTAAALHIGEGPVEYWIPVVAQQQNAALVVIGTHARDGLSGILLGNTAERILDRLTCDVLVMREGASLEMLELLPH